MLTSYEAEEISFHAQVTLLIEENGENSRQMLGITGQQLIELCVTSHHHLKDDEAMKPYLKILSNIKDRLDPSDKEVVVNMLEVCAIRQTSLELTKGVVRGQSADGDVGAPQSTTSTYNLEASSGLAMLGVRDPSQYKVDLTESYVVPACNFPVRSL